MSIFGDDRSAWSKQAQDLDEALAATGLDTVLHNAFETGMNLDEILYVLFSHSERAVKRYMVQDQLKKVAKKEKTENQ